jgi:hypothetical protein
MKYLIPVVLQVNSPTASEAARLVKAEAKKMDKKLRPKVGDPELLDGPRSPNLSTELVSFLKDEVDNNDDDVTAGHRPELRPGHAQADARRLGGRAGRLRRRRRVRPRLRPSRLRHLRRRQ